MEASFGFLFTRLLQGFAVLHIRNCEVIVVDAGLGGVELDGEALLSGLFGATLSRLSGLLLPSLDTVLLRDV